jgi:hypothetical protein
MTDNGGCYRSHAFGEVCRDLGIKHIRKNPTRRERMARQSASSKPRYGNGLMPKPIQPPIAAPKSCRSGCIDTTGTGLMVV